MRIQAILFRSRENHISDVLHNSFARTEINCPIWFMQTDSPQWLIFMTHLKFITGFLTWKHTPEQYETLTVKGDLIISIPRSFEKFSIMWRLWQALVCFISFQQQLNSSDWTRIWPMRWQNWMKYALFFFINVVFETPFSRFTFLMWVIGSSNNTDSTSWNEKRQKVNPYPSSFSPWSFTCNETACITAWTCNIFLVWCNDNFWQHWCIFSNILRCPYQKVTLGQMILTHQKS